MVSCAGRRSRRATLVDISSPLNGVPSAAWRRTWRAILLGQVAELGERLANDPLGRLVEEDERALLVDDRERCGEVRGELPGKDQREAFVRVPLHRLSVLRLVTRANDGYILVVPFSTKQTPRLRRASRTASWSSRARLRGAFFVSARAGRSPPPSRIPCPEATSRALMATRTTPMLVSSTGKRCRRSGGWLTPRIRMPKTPPSREAARKTCRVCGTSQPKPGASPLARPTFSTRGRQSIRAARKHSCTWASRARARS